jgi:hypothetical protein
MSKKRDFQRVAKEAGILKSGVQYYRQSKSYIISIADNPLPEGKGYTTLSVGVYPTVNDAREHLPNDIQACVDHNLSDYPDILERVTERYHPVMLSDRDITYQLLKALLNDPSTAQSAQATLQYIESLESQIQAETVRPKGTYTSQYPDQQKKPIEWQQPDYREHPVYIFVIDCPYCGQHVTLERHSPRNPVHCGEDDCATEHNRTLARERKRRQRERQKVNRE